MLAVERFRGPLVVRRIDEVARLKAREIRGRRLANPGVSPRAGVCARRQRHAHLARTPEPGQPGASVGWGAFVEHKHDLEVRGAPRVRMVRQGVDETLFDLELSTPRAPRVLFLGTLSVPHNIDAAQRLVRDIWPKVRAARPDATLELAGADPIAALLALEGRDGISVPGMLPDLRPVWRRASVMVAPLRFSAGIQNKILEAMAAGVPVVTTAAAAEAILAEHGTHLRIGTTDAELATATLEALGEGESGLAVRYAAREHVRGQFSWQALVARLEELVNESVHR